MGDEHSGGGHRLASRWYLPYHDCRVDMRSQAPSISPPSCPSPTRGEGARTYPCQPAEGKGSVFVLRTGLVPNTTGGGCGWRDTLHSKPLSHLQASQFIAV